MQGWTRATLLNDTATAAALKPLLPQPLQQQLSDPSPLTPWLVLVRNPGLQPNVDAGTQRAYTYDFVESYRLNWEYRPDTFATRTLPPPAWLNAEAAKRGVEEAGKLQSIRGVDAGEKLLAQVRLHPHDPHSSEALYYILRMIRYAGNLETEADGATTDTQSVKATDSRTGRLHRDTVELMRRYYARSAWTKKAAPFVG